MRTLLDTLNNIAESLGVKNTNSTIFSNSDSQQFTLKFKVSLRAVEQWILSRGFCIVEATSQTQRNHVSLQTLVAIRRDCYGLTDEEAEEYRKQREEYAK